MYKKLLAITLSIALIITCMPIMAFADSSATKFEYSDDYSEVTITSADGSKTVDTERKFVDSETTQKTISDNADGYVAPLGSVVVKVPNYDEITYYYDFAGASIVKYDGENILENKISADEYLKMVSTKNGKAKFKSGYDIWDLLSNGEEHYIKFVNPLQINGLESVCVPINDYENLLNISATLPAYEKYKKDETFGVDISLSPVAAKAKVLVPGELFANDDRLAGDILLNTDVITDEYQITICSSDAPKAGVFLDSVGTYQDIDFSKDLNIVLGVYNGETQYTSIRGYNGWAVSGEIEFPKDATINLFDIIDCIEATGDAGITIFREDLMNILLENQFTIEAEKDGVEASTNAAVVILPREFFVEFKADQLNFVKGHKLTKSDLLRMKTWTGYESLMPTIMKYLAPVLTSSDAEEIESEDDDSDSTLLPMDIIEDVLDAIVKLSGKTKADVCDEDKEMAKKFIDKYVILDAMPSVGLNNSINTVDNIDIDWEQLLEDRETDAEVDDFLNNYGLLMQLIETDDARISYVRDFGKHGIGLIGAWYYEYDNTYKISFRTFINSIANTTSTVNFTTALNTISVKDVVKTYHVKKAKTLKKTKTFTFKAKAAYGDVRFQKVSGNKKITINKYTGKVTVKKGLKKNHTYAVRVLVKAPGKSLIKKISIRIVK